MEGCRARAVRLHGWGPEEHLRQVNALAKVAEVIVHPASAGGRGPKRTYGV